MLNAKWPKYSNCMFLQKTIWGLQSQLHNTLNWHEQSKTWLRSNKSKSNFNCAHRVNWTCWPGSCNCIEIPPNCPPMENHKKEVIQSVTCLLLLIALWLLQRLPNYNWTITRAIYHYTSLQRVLHCHHTTPNVHECQRLDASRLIFSDI